MKWWNMDYAKGRTDKEAANGGTDDHGNMGMKNGKIENGRNSHFFYPVFFIAIATPHHLARTSLQHSINVFFRPGLTWSI